jgi:hypothetical protein
MPDIEKKAEKEAVTSAKASIQRQIEALQRRMAELTTLAAEPGAKSERTADGRKRELMPDKLERPVVRSSHGFANCVYCLRPFERPRGWAKYCTTYCRTTDFHVKHRRVGPDEGRVVWIGSTKVTIPPMTPALEREALESKTPEDAEKFFQRFVDGAALPAPRPAKAAAKKAEK